MVPAAGLAVGPCPTCLLVFASLPVLCLGQAIHMQEGVLPTPSIRVEPGPVILRGRPATIVCRGPAGAELFRLEEYGRSGHRDQSNMPQRGSHWAEATFHIDTQNEFTGRYFCRYHKGPSWSEPSEILELKVAGIPGVISSTPLTRTKPLSTAGIVRTPTGARPRLQQREHGTCSLGLDQTLDLTLTAWDWVVARMRRKGHTQTKSPDTKTSEHLYILVGICVASLLCLLLLILLLVHCQHQKKCGPPSSKGEEPRAQERLSPTVDLTESPADVATTVDTLPEENREMHSPSPAAGDPQEVTYAQLDQRALTRRAARAESPLPTEPTAESSTYAVLPRH